MAEAVAPAILLFILLQVFPTDKVTAPVHSSFAGGALTGSTTQMSKPAFTGEVGPEALVEYTLIK
jgi:hypothetical protein